MRSFGIELELVGPNGARGNAQGHARDIIAGLGLRATVASAYGQQYSVWQCKSDISIEPRDRSVEVVSPVMPAQPDSYETVTRVVTSLDGNGYGINRSCGYHVHVNVSDLTVTERLLVVLRYAEKQDEINNGMPPSRRSNNFCRRLDDRAGLERAVDSGRASSWRPGYDSGGSHNHRHYEAVNTAYMHAPGTAARLEFRQAAGTCNAAKVVGWIKMLQEMIDEVVRRARQTTFGGRPITAPVAPVRPTPQPVSLNPLARVPRMNPGSDAHRAMSQLCEHGVVTTQWATANGIAAPVLRRIIVGFRRHGAQLQTTQGAGPGMPAYVLQGQHTLPTTPQAIFLAAAAQPAAAPVTPPPAPQPVPVAPPPVATTTADVFVAYPLTAGFTPETAAWWSDRVDTFNADRA